MTQPTNDQLTSSQLTNTPGRPTVARRVGTAGDFAARMAAELTRQPELDAFTNRRSDDPAIALVDAWAAVLDVLAFYSERVANEGYLRTAIDPRSVTELAHSVGYAPGRGRASATSLAFTLEDAVGSPVKVPIPAGTKVASLPGPGEVPQNYETTADLEARPAWNAIQARTRLARVPGPGALGAYVEGIRTDLRVGDAVLLVGTEREIDSASSFWAFRRLATVKVLTGLDATWVGWVDALGKAPAGSGRETAEHVPAPEDLRIYLLRRKAAVFGAAAPDYRLINESAGGGRPDPRSAGSSVQAFDAGIQHEVQRKISQQQQDILEGQVRGGDTIWGEVSADPGRRHAGPDWPGFSVRAPDRPENTVDLDTTYAEAVPGSWAVFSMAGATVCYEVLTATEESRTDFTLNGKVTRLGLRGPTVSHLFGAHVRQTSVWIGSELLLLASAPVSVPVQGLQVELARAVPTLEAGRTVIVRGPRPWVRVAERVRNLELKAPFRPVVKLHAGEVLEVVGPVTENANGTITWATTRGSVTATPGTLLPVPPPGDATVWSETATIAGPTPDEPSVGTLRFTAVLTGCYDRGSVRILGNVAPATHGETRTQVLGSGDAAVPYQRFRLSQVPLTYVLARTGGSVLSTLEVRVDGRLWTEVPQLFGTGPDDEVFTTQQDDEGNVAVLFGDGETGSRLPTGTNNVTATYRVGTGIAGRLPADQLTLPMTRPLGLRSVTNPLPTGLAADPEPAAEVRTNAPRTALTLERVVSLRDVEDFARAVPGVGKARATWLWNGRQRFVHLTVAGTSGQTIDVQAVRDLKAALLAAGDQRLPLQVAVAEVVQVHVSVSVVVDPRLEPQGVLDGVTRSVTAALSSDARTLGQPLTGGDIIIAAHAVPGVVAVNVTLPKTDVPSAAARMTGGIASAAQLVVLAHGGLTVTEASA